MYAAIIFNANLIKAFHDNTCIFLIVSNAFTALFNAFFAEYSLCTALDNVRNSIELSGLATQPHFVQFHFLAAFGFTNQCMRNNGITATGTGKAGSLGQRAQLNSAFFSILDNENAARNCRISYICFISSIVQNNSIVFQCISNPFFQLLFGISRTGRVVRRAQINYVSLYIFVRHRQEIIFRLAFHINNVTAAHNVGIQIYRVYRIRNQDSVCIAENIGDISAITLCTVADENFIAFQGNTEGSIIFYQCRMQKIIALLRTIATESFLYAHFCYSFRHCINNTFCQRQGNVTNTQADNLFVRMCLSISAYLVRDISKKKALF